MTLAQFSEMFALLAVQLRQTDADEATIRAYYAALKDCEPEFVAMAAQRFASSAEWFPKTSEWKELAVKIEHEREQYQRDLMRKMPTPLCLVCGDTSWERQTVSESDRVIQVERVRPCACRSIRRAEVLGRRPWPALTEAPPDVVQRELPAVVVKGMS